MTRVHKPIPIEEMNTPCSNFCQSFFPTCIAKKQLQVHKQAYRIEGRIWYVLYEYNDFLERLWFRYKEQRDIVLAPIFLEEVRASFFSKYCVCGLCSSEKKRLDRGFEPLKEIFMAQGIEFYSPFYKNRDWKQNHQHKQERKKIAQILEKKSLYPLPNKAICLVDDVCTSGASLEAALSQMVSFFLIRYY